MTTRLILCLFLSACAPADHGALIYMLGDAVSDSDTTGE